MNCQDIVVGDEVSFVGMARTGYINVFGQSTGSRTTLHGVVTATDHDALHVILDPSKPVTVIPWTEISDIELAGLNPHRLDPTKSPVVVRVYPGHRQSDAAAIYGDEAVILASHGYLPVAHSWAVGEPGIGRVMAFGMLGAVAMRPEGALVVTYVHRSRGRSE
jgi:hypothetical protein